MPRSCRASSDRRHRRGRDRLRRSRGRRDRGRDARAAGDARRGWSEGSARAIVLKWAATPEMRARRPPLVANSPAAALALADDLARLMDDMATRQVSWDRLDDLVPTDMDEFWKKTLEFLQIARDQWPAILERARRDRAGGAPRPADRGGNQAARNRRRPGDRGGLHRLDPGDRDAARDHREIAARRAGAARPRHRSRRRDLDLIASRDGETGAVHGHPQFAMPALLQRIGIVRDASKCWASPPAWPRTARLGGAAARRGHRALAAAPRRGRFAPRRHALKHRRDRGGQRRGRGAGDRGRAPRDDGRSGQDRRAGDARPTLARRVLAALARWNVRGRRFRRRRARRYAGRRVRAARRRGGARRPAARHAARAAQASAVPLDARAIATLERAILRGPRPKPRHAGLAHALQPSART